MDPGAGGVVRAGAGNGAMERVIDTAAGFSPWTPGVFGLAVFAAVVLALLLVLAARLNPGRASAVKGAPYECGVAPGGPARARHPAAFYLVAMFFLLFDVEAVYIFSWAVAFDRSPAGFWSMAFFILMLLAGLGYVWRKGGLEWGPRKD